MIYIDRKRFLVEKMMNYTLSTNRVLFLCADQYFFSERRIRDLF